MFPVPKWINTPVFLEKKSTKTKCHKYIFVYVQAMDTDINGTYIDPRVWQLNTSSVSSSSWNCCVPQISLGVLRGSLSSTGCWGGTVTSWTHLSPARESVATPRPTWAAEEELTPPKNSRTLIRWRARFPTHYFPSHLQGNTFLYVCTSETWILFFVSGKKESKSNNNNNKLKNRNLFWTKCAS